MPCPPQTPKLSGMYSLGGFTYAPYESGEVKKPNYVLHKTGGNAWLSYEIAPYVKEMNQDVFKKAGLQLGTTPYIITASVDTLFVDDVGYTYGFTYTVTYRIMDKTGKEILKRTYTQQVDVGVYFNVNFTVSLNNLYTAGAIRFMNDAEVMKLLGWQPAG